MLSAKERNYGIDLLRMVSMFMVALLHVMGQGGILATASPLSIDYEAAWFVEIAAFCAVNCYALISGYVGINGRFKYTNIIVMWLQVTFYTVIITIIFAVVRPEIVGVRQFIYAICPVMTTQYWYFTAYFCLFFFIPIINKAVKSLPKNNLKYLMSVMVIVFSVIPTLFRRDVFHTNFGCSGLWLILLYILGAYIKEYNIVEKISIKRSSILYLGCIVLTWLGKLFLEKFSLDYFGEIRWGNVLVQYTSPTILLSAVALLSIFSKIDLSYMSKRIIKIFTPATFGVYLIHAQPLVWQNILKDRFVNYVSGSAVHLVFGVLFTAMSIYFLCSLIDLARNKIFKVLRIKQSVERLEKRLIAPSEEDEYDSYYHSNKLSS